MQWEYTGQFLEQFETKYRGTIGDQFCRIIRQGHKLPTQIIWVMQRNCENRMRSSDDHSQFYEQLYFALSQPNDAVEFVEFLLERENLSWEEKQKLKSEWQAENKNSWQKSQPPTEKQLNYLKALHCETIPENKFEASQLIEQCLKTKDKNPLEVKICETHNF